MYYKNSTKRFIASFALLSQLVYTVNPFVYAFISYSMSSQVRAQEAPVDNSEATNSSDTQSSSDSSTASEDSSSSASEESPKSTEEPVVSNTENVLNDVEVAQESQVEGGSEVVSTEETVAETPSENTNTESDNSSDTPSNNDETVTGNELPTAGNSTEEPSSTEIPGEILGEGATSVRTDSQPADFIEAKEQVNGMECIDANAEIATSSEDMWNVDSSNDSAETKEDVKAGVKYEFPLNKDISVTFTCLPKDSEKISSLKIEQIKVSDLDLPEGVYPADEYAYDITTTMENGTFEYSLTMPSTELDKGKVKLNYVEKDATSKIEKADLNEVDSTNIEYGDRKLEVTELDHFTIFVKTYVDLLFTVEGTSFARGSQVPIKASGLLTNKYY